MALVEIRNVHKSFQRDTQAIEVFEDLTLDLEERSFTALMGPSGSGKSTLLNLVAGLDRPTRGTITVAGARVSAMAPTALAAWRARHIGFVFQSYNLLPVLTAFQNVELPLLLTRLSRKERDERVRVALGVVGLDDRLQHYPRQLSGGQEQRVAIARAIVTDPTILVADEPTGDLDAKSAEEILLLLTQLNRQFHKTIVMVTHDPRSERFVDTVYRLDKGVFIGSEQGGMSATPRVSLPPPAEARRTHATIHTPDVQEPVA